MYHSLTLIIVKDISQSFVNVLTSSSIFFTTDLYSQTPILPFFSLILLSLSRFTTTTPIYTMHLIITFSLFGL